jgi:Mlc titration factor MtfA (ptsG expression regulator)
VRHYLHLSAAEQTKLQDDLRILVAEKNWEGCRGLMMTDEIKVTIAAQAAMLTLGFNDEHFDKIQSILVYPDAYIAEGHSITKGGLVLEGESNRLGEAWYRGPVVFSWADALAGGRDETDGHNLVIHEFAHQLDMLNGRVIDGTPNLATRGQFDRWQVVIEAAAMELGRDCAQGQRTLLDCYGTTNIGEFFAVSVECFFERPDAMQKRHADLYDIFREYFNQDHANRTYLETVPK